MRLTPTEQDRLLIFLAAQLARARQARGLRLNVPEATALIADTVCEVARDGGRLADALAAGRVALADTDVLPGVPAVVRDVRVEAVFDDGSRLVVVTDPFGAAAPELGPGAVRPAVKPVGPVPDTVELVVANTADVAITVTSHWHFFEANPRLRFDRATAYGQRLAIAAGSSVRFDSGAHVTVSLRPIGGARVVIGFAGLVDGPLDGPGVREEALRRARAWGYLDVE